VLQPYKHWEDNVFKVLVEVHIFLVVTVSLVLKFLNSGVGSDQEALTVAFYDWVLVGSFVVGVPIGFVCTVCAKRSMMRASLRERAVVGDDEESSVKAKQRAIRLLHLGLTTNDDMRLLGAYFGRLENMVNKWSHVFISYRVAADRDLARRLYDELSAATIEETGQKLRVYLDQERLEDGQRWDSGFMEGLAKSWVFVPIVSVDSVRPMLQLSPESDWCDNVLLEWTAALERACEEFDSQPWILQEFREARMVEHPYYDPRTGAIETMRGRVRLCPYYFVDQDGRSRLGGCLAAIAPADKKKIHGMRDAILTVCVADG